MNRLRIVDADSQFTRNASTKAMDWKLNERVSSLVRGKMLLFGHKTFGHQHDTFVVLLRRFRDTHGAELYEDIRRACKKTFNGIPDIILYPGESTAAYLVFKVAEALGPTAPPVTIVLNPAFRTYGRSQVRPELSRNHVLLKKERLKVLLFDDSISTGNTEAHAIDSLEGLGAGTLQWLTYVVLWRGKRSAATQERNLHTIHSNKLEYAFSYFCSIGPETVTQVDCPLCPASDRLKAARAWAAGCRNGVTSTIEAAAAYMDPGPLERIDSESVLLDPELTESLLALEIREIHEVCVFLTEEVPDTPIRSLASLLFLALHFTDVRSYLSLSRLNELVLDAIRRAPVDGRRDSLIVSIIAMLPISDSKGLASKIITLFLDREKPDAASAIAAVVIANHHHLLHAAVKPNVAKARHDEFISELQDSLAERQRSLTSDSASNAAVVERDVNMLAFGNKDNIVRLAQNVSVLLGEGRHELFLRRQLQKVATDNIQGVRINVDHVLDLISQLSDITSAGLREEILAAKNELRAVADTPDPERFKVRAEFWLTRLWKESALSQLLYWPQYLADWLEQALSSLQNATGLDHRIFSITSPDDHDRRWLCFGPANAIVRDHFRNLLDNALRYSRAGRRAADRSAISAAAAMGQPLFRAVFATARDSLLLVCADRSPALDPVHLFSGSTGLASARAQFSFFGGTVEYQAARNPSPEVSAVLSKHRIDRDVYRNLFVTTFPLLLKNRYE